MGLEFLPFLLFEGEGVMIFQPLPHHGSELVVTPFRCGKANQSAPSGKLPLSEKAE
jgi:hypothetical protein